MVVVGVVVAAKLGIVSLPGRALINEKFPSSNGQWLVRSDPQVQAGFLDGSYQILVRAPNLDFESIRAGVTSANWKPGSDRVEQLRMLKDESELAAIRDSIAIARWCASLSGSLAAIVPSTSAPRAPARDVAVGSGPRATGPRS